MVESDLLRPFLVFGSFESFPSFFISLFLFSFLFFFCDFLVLSSFFFGFVGEIGKASVRKKKKKGEKMPRLSLGAIFGLN